MRGFWKVLSWLLCASAPASAWAQAATPAGSGRTIHLDVTVTDKAGAPVAGLLASDFTILDNRAARPVTSFRAVSGADVKASVIIVVDDVNIATAPMSDVRLRVLRYLRGHDGKLAYPTTLAIATEDGLRVMGGYTTDGNLLAGAFEKIVIPTHQPRRDASLAGAAERVQICVNDIRQIATKVANYPGRKAILWVSGGWDAVSGPGVDEDDKQKARMFRDIVAMSTDLRQDRVLLESIDPFGVGQGNGHIMTQQFLKPVTKPADAQFGNLMLQVLALQSGGLDLFSSNALEELMDRAVASLATFYELEYEVTAPETPNTFHRIEVRVSKPNLQVNTRQGVYLQP